MKTQNALPMPMCDEGGSVPDLSDDSPEALCRLGRRYMLGEGEERSYEKALLYFTESCKKGSSEALLYMGMIYESEDFEGRDIRQALECYLRALDGGQPRAAFFISRLYCDGIDVEQDYGSAMDYALRGAERDPDCQYIIGELHING